MMGGIGSDPVPPLAGCGVLVVEDGYLIASEVKRWLRSAGAEVIGPVPRADLARDLIAEQQLDAAVLDVNLGDGDTAYPVATKPNVLGAPFLFATGDVRVSGASAGSRRRILEKPFVAAELVRVLPELVAAR
ncbi:Response regulator receiver domain-containing protein [Methylobacterium sp. UNC378MF]|uniref:response regulator n=1 Tax=Methylobacterium sp. UNC378MF TaxID=1502748 RepID=UPI0008858133|nr:response regulator [Methylobacterium sp. UNC378MF]SDA09846.1 Response regulator receiver domain-containing protein [Methylobacterium sp. UNC378MF]